MRARVFWRTRLNLSSDGNVQVRVQIDWATAAASLQFCIVFIASLNSIILRTGWNKRTCRENMRLEHPLS
jgi:hypothetical protein